MPDTTQNHPYRLAVVGSRDFNYPDIVQKFLDNIFKWDTEYENKTGVKRSSYELVSGGGGFVDLFAERYARNQGYPVKIFLPKTGPDGRWLHKGSGIERNREIAAYADGVIAFLDITQNYKTSGTLSTCQFAAELTKPVRIITGIEGRLDLSFLGR